MSAAGGANSQGVQEAAAALKKTFEEGVAASNGRQARRGDRRSSSRAIAVNPNCSDCYNNIGYSYTQKKEYDKAEEAYKKATEIRRPMPRPTTASPTSTTRSGSSISRPQASAKATELSGWRAGGGGNADALYNQGVILFNGGKSGEAKPLFEQVVKSNRITPKRTTCSG